MTDTTGHYRFFVDTIAKLAITNDIIACKVPIDAEDGITVFNGKEINATKINSNCNIDVSFQKIA